MLFHFVMFVENPTKLAFKHDVKMIPILFLKDAQKQTTTASLQVMETIQIEGH